MAQLVGLWPALASISQYPSSLPPLPVNNRINSEKGRVSARSVGIRRSGELTRSNRLRVTTRANERAVKQLEYVRKLQEWH